MRRTESGEKDSRQKGHAGWRRGVVFSTMAEQQLAQRTWPVRAEQGPEERKREKKHTAWDGVRETLGRILLCTDITRRSGLESEHGASAQRSWAKGKIKNSLIYSIIPPTSSIPFRAQPNSPQKTRCRGLAQFASRPYRMYSPPPTLVFFLLIRATGIFHITH